MLLVSAVIVLGSGAVAWQRSTGPPVFHTSGRMSLATSTPNVIGAGAHAEASLRSPAVASQIHGLVDLRRAELITPPTVEVSTGSYAITVETTDAEAGSDVVDFVVVYLTTVAAQDLVDRSASRVEAAAQIAATFAADLAALERRVGIAEVGAAYDRVSAQVLDIELQLAAAASPGVQAATAALLERRVATQDGLSAVLPEWRALEARSAAAEVQLVEAAAADELAASVAADLMSATGLESSTTIEVRGPSNDLQTTVAIMMMTAALLLLAAGALRHRRKIIEETLAAARSTGPLPAMGPGQFSSPDPHPAAAVVHRPDGADNTSQPVQAAATPDPLSAVSSTRHMTKRARFVVVDQTAATEVSGSAR